MMSSKDDFNPDWVSPPGETIADVLQERSYSQSEFALRMGYTPQHVNELLKSRVPISPETARKLELVLGSTADFWKTREKHYRGTVSDALSDTECKGHDDWLKELPLRDMREYGWLDPDMFAVSPVAACLRFFGVANVEAWRSTYREVLDTAVFRTSPSFASRPAALAAWLRQGEIEAAKLECKPWELKGFQKVLSEIRPLTRKRDPKAFLPEVARLCSEFGVAVVIVRGPKGCHASGATRFLSPNKAMLLLSFRHLSDDHFWFTFFHEAGHLVLHSKKALFLEGVNLSNAQEDEANKFSANILIPPQFEPSLVRVHVDRHEIRNFARKVGVSPGIVLGQLQHRGLARRNQLNMLKVRFRWG
jgi:HTH-type transcriptional regulator / antitoxin HigA